MITLYLFLPGQSHPYPVNRPTTFVRSEAMDAAASALRRGRAFELWEDGRCVGSGGPSTPLACPVRLRRV
jgi:hypothetical protein